MPRIKKSRITDITDNKQDVANTDSKISENKESDLPLYSKEVLPAIETPFITKEKQEDNIITSSKEIDIMLKDTDVLPSDESDIFNKNEVDLQRLLSIPPTTIEESFKNLTKDDLSYDQYGNAVLYYQRINTDLKDIDNQTIHNSTVIRENRGSGYISSFFVRCNSPDIRVVCKYLDERNNTITISNKTMREWAILGMGITSGETLPDGTGTSKDQTGSVNPYFPYISRYKNTYTGIETDYETSIRGTDNDNQIVLMYTPEHPRMFKSVLFYIENTSTTGNAIIFEYEVNINFIIPNYILKNILIDASEQDPTDEAKTLMVKLHESNNVVVDDTNTNQKDDIILKIEDKTVGDRFLRERTNEMRDKKRNNIIANVD